MVHQELKDPVAGELERLEGQLRKGRKTEKETHGKEGQAGFCPYFSCCFLLCCCGFNIAKKDANAVDFGVDQSMKWRDPLRYAVDLGSQHASTIDKVRA